MKRCGLPSCWLAGIDAEGLAKDLECHHLIVNDWDDITAEQNVCIGSIPTVFNPKLAPKGKALVHAYCAANEPYSLWEGLDRKSQEYKDFKVGFLLLVQKPQCHSRTENAKSRN